MWTGVEMAPPDDEWVNRTLKSVGLVRPGMRAHAGMTGNRLCFSVFLSCTTGGKGLYSPAVPDKREKKG